RVVPRTCRHGTCLLFPFIHASDQNCWLGLMVHSGLLRSMRLAITVQVWDDGIRMAARSGDGGRKTSVERPSYLETNIPLQVVGGETKQQRRVKKASSVALYALTSEERCRVQTTGYRFLSVS